ncbi:MAG TPA: metalloregulator ArsR/SmtB family transcription factor [Candidatus Krumholzibacteria bacterium]|nr:metalloregulator ArsR/SmtB family transcription factor [Candidatus Krumholzibacteria bacterium]HRY41288.1 metalloregulator ArsR/SmtB family transcription factor [Candidatus Krumholzibacteria bacterium]
MTTPRATAPVDLDRIFSAIADPTRRAILTRLASGSATVTELARPFPMSLPAVSKHLRVLERAGLMRRQVEGRVHHCQVVPEALDAAERWLVERHEFWNARLASLRDHVEGSDAAAGAAPDPDDSSWR